MSNSICWSMLCCLLLTCLPAPATETNKHKAAGVLARADALKIQQEYKSALPLYQQAVKLQPTNSNAHAGLGWVLFNLGNRQRGLLEAEKAVSLDRRNPAAHHHLGTIYWMLNRPAEAASQFRTEYAIDPKRNCHCGPMESLLEAYPAGPKNGQAKH